jgi:hypothetical protein
MKVAINFHWVLSTDGSCHISPEEHVCASLSSLPPSLSLCSLRVLIFSPFLSSQLSLSLHLFPSPEGDKRAGPQHRSRWWLWVVGMVATTGPPSPLPHPDRQQAQWIEAERRRLYAAYQRWVMSDCGSSLPPTMTSGVEWGLNGGGCTWASSLPHWWRVAAADRRWVVAADRRRVAVDRWRAAVVVRGGGSRPKRRGSNPSSGGGGCTWPSSLLHRRWAVAANWW